MKIKVINPNTSEPTTDIIEIIAKSSANSDTDIIVVNPNMGPASIESNYDGFLSIPGMLKEVKSSGDQIDAFVIACFGDPGVQAAREITSAPVIGIAEASLYLASILAPKFSVLTASPRDKLNIGNLIKSYGMDFRIASIRPTYLGVLDFNNDPIRGIQALRQEGLKAVKEDGAEAILLGCAGMASFSNQLEKELNVPVIDGIGAAVKFAESIVNIGKSTSKILSYGAPEKKRFTGILSNFSSSKQ